MKCRYLMRDLVFMDIRHYRLLRLLIINIVIDIAMITMATATAQMGTAFVVVFWLETSICWIVVLVTGF